MSSAQTIHGDEVWRALEGRQNEELRFRSAVITSTALHTGLTLAFLLAPLLISPPQLFQLTPVNMVQLQAPEPAPTPPAAEEEEAAPEEEAPEPEPAEPEPAEPEPPEPDDVPEDLEAQRRAEQEEAARLREERLAEERRERDAEAERQRLADEARRRREADEAEARRRAEEEARERAQPQVATRRPTQEQTTEVTQQAERGEVGMSFGEELSERDKTLLDYWINRVLTNINRNWQPQVRPAGSREIVAVVHFRVGRDGQLLVGPDVRSGSGDRRYDDAAARAVQAGQPFPPLPQAYRGSTLTINLAFRQE